MCTGSTADKAAGLANGSLRQVPIGGGTPLTLALAQANPVVIAVDAANVYWGNQVSAPNQVFGSVPIGGGAVNTVASLPAPLLGNRGINDLVARGGSIFWPGSSDTNGVFTAPIGGGPFSQFFVPTSGTFLSDITADASNLYATINGSTSGGVFRLPLGGGAAVSLTTVTQSSVKLGTIVIDGTSAYFVDVNNGNLWKAPLAGGTATILVPGVSPAGLAVDSTAVYWTDIFTAGGSIMKVAK